MDVVTELFTGYEGLIRTGTCHGSDVLAIRERDGAVGRILTPGD
jgi:hypothetical protein